MVDDGPTLYQALANLNTSLESLPGSPWFPSQIYGVASPIPVNPSSWGWDEYDGTLASCQAAFHGLTIWNGTLPLFLGTYNSGTAPFWQIVYFSNVTQQLAVATDIRGALEVYPPISMSSPCAVDSGLGYEPWRWMQFWPVDGFPGDTPVMASDAWNVVAKSYVAWLARPVAEMYIFGADQFGSGQSSANQVNFFTCGTVGGAGVARGLAIYGSTDSPDDSGNTWNYSLGCTPTNDNWTAIGIQMDFANSSVSVSGKSAWISREFQLRYLPPSPLSGPAYNARGITSWMTRVYLNNSEGMPMSMASPDCEVWVSSVYGCAANSSGWYAVLLSPDGSWEGTFGETPSGPMWSYPVLPIANNETIVLVVPATWTVSGDEFSVGSTTSQLPLGGATTLESG
ncbi:MAG TPA: hypothetical protein VEL82_07695 [Thermoplasmata archaeon]|nr:hypothetical protein [Thermoplasmata archaeon]